MQHLDKILGRWWQGAVFFLICGASYTAAFTIAALPIVVADELALYEPTNWTYWIAAAVLAPFLAGTPLAARLFRAVADDEGENPRP